MTDTINLKQLRQDASGHDDHTLLPNTILVDLIDTVEATIAFLSDWNSQDFDRLIETLSRFEQT